MKSWQQAFNESLFVGSVASLASLAAMAVCGRRDNRTLWPAVNAPSHWVWDEKALHQEQPSLRYTLPGFLIHHLSSHFWALLHAKARAERRREARTLLGEAALTTVVAATVDLVVVPERLTPGFQRRLSPASLTTVYVLFGLGLAAGTWLIDQRSARCGGRSRRAQPSSSSTGSLTG